MRSAVAVLSLASAAVLFCISCSAVPGSSAEKQVEPNPLAPTDTRAPLRLIVISDLEGVLEPCGCGNRPAGGIDRLAAAIERLRATASHALTLATGNLLFDPDSAPDGRSLARAQDSWKADTLSELLIQLRIDLIAPGPRDLDWGAARLLELSLARPGAISLISAGATVPRVQGLATSDLRRLGSTLVGTTAATDIAVLKTQVALLRRRGAVIVIAALHGDAPTAQQAAEVIDADIVVHSGAGDQRPGAVLVANRTVLVHAGRHGEGILSMDLWPGAAGARLWRVSETSSQRDVPLIDTTKHTAVVRFQALDEKAPRDPDVRARLDRLFARINAHNLASAEGPPGASARDYVGSETCAACHTQAYFWWLATPHGRAFETLVKRGRQFDLDCVGCHVTGFDGHAPSLSGVEQRKGVGCESCHGPGSAHAENPRPPHRGLQREAPERVCIGCHDREHSAAFNYATHKSLLLVKAHGGTTH